MKKTMIEYILENTSENWITGNAIRSKKKSSKFERLHIKVDDQIQYCTSCKLTWKKNRKMINRSWEYFPKNNMPTIGKKRQLCPNCKEKNDSL